MLPRIALEKYCSFIVKKHFWIFVRKWAFALYRAIWNKSLNEPQVVKRIVQELNGLGFAGIRTYTTFIHQKPYVRFYDDNLTERKAELGDLIFIISIIHKRRKIFERVTINQAKKGTAPKIDARQLFLLSRFPAFRLPKKWGGKVYALPNYSHCLGSHSLLGDEFTFISSVLLDYALGPNQPFKVDKLTSLFNHKDFLFPRIVLKGDSFSIVNQCKSNLREKLRNCPDRFCYLWLGHCWHWGEIPPAPMIRNFGYAWNAGRFASGYLLSWIGEIIWGNPSSPNPQAWELIQDIVSSAMTLGDKTAQEFVAKFHEYPYEGKIPGKRKGVAAGNNGGITDDEDADEDVESGGFGIVYTEVNLDEVD